MRIHRTKNSFTRYEIKDDMFRIKQTSDTCFNIQKYYVREETNGYLWWKKTTETADWFSCDYKCRVLNEMPYDSHKMRFACYMFLKTKKEAVKFLEDFEKYPVIL